MLGLAYKRPADNGFDYKFWRWGDYWFERGNDTIVNTGDNSIIDAGAGNNFVSVSGSSFVTARTGNGNNIVRADNNGGNGITLHNGSFSIHVESGGGDDTVAVEYNDIAVDSNDIINGFIAEGTLKVSGVFKGYAITIESGVNVTSVLTSKLLEKGVVVLKTAANTSKYSLDADFTEWQYQRYSIDSGNEVTFVFGENG